MALTHIVLARNSSSTSTDSPCRATCATAPDISVKASVRVCPTGFHSPDCPPFANMAAVTEVGFNALHFRNGIPMVRCRARGPRERAQLTSVGPHRGVHERAAPRGHQLPVCRPTFLA